MSDGLVDGLLARIAELEKALQNLLSAMSRSDFSFATAVTVTQAVAEARALVGGKGNE
jgi:hypothetical protein